jgi:predicted protein tyrosine phosphatase
MWKTTCLLTAAVPDHALTDDPGTTKERLPNYPKKPSDLSYRNYRRHISHGGRHVSLYARPDTSSRGLDDDATATDSSYLVSQRGIHIFKEERCRTCYSIQLEKLIKDRSLICHRQRPAQHHLQLRFLHLQERLCHPYLSQRPGLAAERLSGSETLLEALSILPPVP